MADHHAAGGRAAEAAATYAVLQQLLEEFETSVDFVRFTAREHNSDEILQQHPVEQELLQDYKCIRVKAVAWAARCSGGPEAVRQALKALPLPAPELLEGTADAGAEVVAARLLREADEPVLRAVTECPICFSTISSPVTTPCGHTFCQRCLARTLDREAACPLCRGKLSSFVAAHGVSEQLEALLSALWPEEARSRKLQEVAEELEEPCAEGGGREWLPTLTPLLAFPTQSCTIHISEPHHKLMVRRALHSGLRSIGACPNAELGQAPLGDQDEVRLGTELQLGAIHQLHDGCSLVEVTGNRRFRIVQSQLRDGYARARVEYLEDSVESVPVAVLAELVEALRGSGPAGISLPLPVLQAAAEGRGLSAEAAAKAILSGGHGKASEFVWAALHSWVGPMAMKAPLLALPSATDRARRLAEMLRSHGGANAGQALAAAAVAAEALASQFRALREELAGSEV